MCLVALAWNVHPRWRLVAAGNRDEVHARPTAALARWSDAPILAGRDLRAGGTWMGLGPHGRMAVVTNVRNGRAPPYAGPSRGALPLRFLAGTDAAPAYAAALAREPGRYAPFNLLVADADACAYVGHRPAGEGGRRLTPGIYGLSNGALDAPWPKTTRLRDVLAQWIAAGEAELEPLWAALADERVADDALLPDTGVGLALERRLSAAFIREHDYGTRASTLVLVGHDGGATIIERRFGPGGVFEGETALEATP